jgi:hypothetical protein
MLAREIRAGRSLRQLAGSVLVKEIGNNVLLMMSVQVDVMVETLPSNRGDESLGVYLHLDGG